jgi:hypothetical protein
VCHTNQGTAGAYAARTAIQSTITNKDHRCTSCHFESSDATGTTGVQAPHKSAEKLAAAPLGTTAEWALAKATQQGGGHNSIGTATWPRAGTPAQAYGTLINGVTMTGTWPALGGTMATTSTPIYSKGSAGVAGSMVGCTAKGCHYRTTAPSGPQGASVPWYFDNGTQVTGQITTHWYTVALVNTVPPAATGCGNCHTALSSTAHRSNHRVACQQCHIRIPHAWKRPRLLRRNINAGGTSNAAADALPYSDPAQVGLEGYQVTAAQTNFSGSGCNDNCTSTAHSAGAPYWP